MSDIARNRPITGLDETSARRGEAPDPIQRKSAGPVAWFDPRKRRLGQLAFSMNRITGLGLVFYLYLHLAVLSQLLAGPSAWSGFLRRATTPVFLGLDVILIAGCSDPRPERAPRGADRQRLRPRPSEGDVVDAHGRSARSC